MTNLEWLRSLEMKEHYGEIDICLANVQVPNKDAWCWICYVDKIEDDVEATPICREAFTTLFELLDWLGKEYDDGDC